MVKNEHDSIMRTLHSAAPYVHAVKIYDTGSTDITLDLAREWASLTEVCTAYAPYNSCSCL